MPLKSSQLGRLALVLGQAALYLSLFAGAFFWLPLLLTLLGEDMTRDETYDMMKWGGFFAISLVVICVTLAAVCVWTEVKVRFIIHGEKKSKPNKSMSMCPTCGHSCPKADTSKSKQPDQQPAKAQV